MASESQYRRDPAAEKLIRGINVSVFQRPKLEAAEEAVDNQFTRPNHKVMTDLTRQEVDAKLAQNRAEVDARLANFDTSIKTGFAELRVEMAKMRGDSEKQSHDSTKWIVGAVFGMLSLSVAILAAIINYSKGDKAPVPAPAPIIVYAQPAPQAPAQAQPPTK